MLDKVSASIEMMYGAAPTGGGSVGPITSEQIHEALAPMRRRVWVTETNVGRLAKCLAEVGALGAYEPFTISGDVPVDKE